MKVNTGLPANDLNAVGAAAKAVEEGGFSGVSNQENRQDAFLPLAVAATHTENLELRTNIAIAFSRSPMVAANLGWDIQHASAGRFTLGNEAGDTSLNSGNTFPSNYDVYGRVYT